MDTPHGDALSADKLALLEQRLRGALDAVPPSPAAVPRPTRLGSAPLSPAQEQLWYFSRLAPDNPVYNEAVSIRKDGPLDLRAFRAAFNEILRRHEIWRSTFAVDEGRPVQIVHPAPTLELPVIDIRGTPVAAREREAVRIVAQEARVPYDLEQGPLIRPLLFRFADDHHRLYLSLHHIVFDGISLSRVILPELITLYETFSDQRTPALPEPLIQYADYAVAMREATNSGDEARNIDYWRRHLDGAAPLQLPLDHPRAPQQRFRGSMTSVHVGSGVADELRSIARTSSATLFQVVAAAFAVLLHRFSGQDDIVFGTLTDMRHRSELERMVGYCVTPLVLRVDLNDDPCFLDLLDRCKGELLAGLAHLMPFERLVQALQPRRQPGANTLFQVGCVLQPRTVTGNPTWSLHLAEVAVGNAVGNAKFDLLLELDERPEGHIDGRLTYDRDLLSHETAARLVACWTTLLGGIAANPRRHVSVLPLLTEEQRHRQLVEWNDTAATYARNACLHELVEDQVKRTPDAVAAVFDDEKLTYRQLDERANGVAARLTALNPQRGLVAIYLERSLDMLVGMLAILKSGAAYLALDRAHPARRLSLMLEDSKAMALLTDSRLLATLRDPPARVVCIDGDPAGEFDQVKPRPAVNAEDLAYVLYTSGSTGTPKGVCISHRSVVNLLTAVARELGMGSGDTIMAITTYAFDIAVIELWLPLVTGARLVMASSEVAADGRRLVALVERSDITIMQATPATWQMIIDAGWRGDPELRAVSTGETLSLQLAESLLERAATVWNMYGPTETTVWSTGVRVQRGVPLTIGRPIANNRIYILGRGRQPVPVGVTGELAIAGDGVGAGYLNRPGLTSEQFVPDPFVANKRMYLTGDLARYLPDGQIEHLGRLDHQIKIRGFRVEPGEIEAALTAAPNVAEAVVVAQDHELVGTRLIAYVVPTGAPPQPSDLRSRLRATLPAYMVPSVFVILEALPLSANGKIDRAALPEPSMTHDAGAARNVAPRNAGEQRMANIWAEVLDVRKVGIDEDFFELGGHSLLALRVLAEVERELGIELPLISFFDSTSVTVASLAAEVEITRKQESDTGTRMGQPEQEPSVVFFVQPLRMLAIRRLTRALGSDFRVVGVRLPDGIVGRFDRSQSIEDIARPMLDTVRRTQPRGPFFIAGYSLGGVLAYEIAGRLEALGEQVAWLGVLEGFTPSAAVHWLRLRQRAVRQWRRGPRGGLAKFREALRRKLTLHLVRLRPQSAQNTSFDGRGAIKLVARYACPPNSAPMDLFVTGSGAAASGSDSLGWDEVHAGPLRVHSVDGDHSTMMTDWDTGALAEIVSTTVKEAHRALPGS